jgi:predicted nucleic acid-binding protein
MRVIFADTSYYIALLQRSDDLHSQAVRFSDTYRGRVVTTAWVLAELGNYLSPINSRASFVTLVAILRKSPYVSIIQPNSRYFDAGLELYSKRSDKAWSLVDCMSFLTMEQHGITEALTGDHHFKQAGFNALLT